MSKKCDWCNKNEAPLIYSGSRQHKYQVKEGFLSYKEFCSEKCKQEYLDSKNNSSSFNSDDSNYLGDEYDRLEKQREKVSETNSKRIQENLERDLRMSSEIKKAERELKEMQDERERLEEILRKQENEKKKTKEKDKAELEKIWAQKKNLTKRGVSSFQMLIDFSDLENTSIPGNTEMTQFIITKYSTYLNKASEAENLGRLIGVSQIFEWEAYLNNPNPFDNEIEFLNQLAITIEETVNDNACNYWDDYNRIIKNINQRNISAFSKVIEKFDYLAKNTAFAWV